ncbi:MAG: LexA binding domain, partial [Sporomusa sp.]|nr:LexA binding domain [Sporomusa sp.]
PTVREISFAVGRSVSTTHKTLEKLKEKGFVTWEPTKCRTVKLVHHV